MNEATSEEDFINLFDKPTETPKGDEGAKPEDTQDTSEPAKPLQESAEEPEGQPDAEPESTTEADDEDVEGDDPETDDQPADEELEAQPDEGKFYDLPDGSKVTFAQLRDGYMREQDYSKKTEELSQQRKAYESEVTTIRQRSLEGLEAVQKRFAAFDPETRLLAELREAYDIGDNETANSLRWQLQDVREAKNQLDQAIAWEKEQSETKQTEAEKQKNEAYLKEQRSLLAEKMPILAKEEGRKKFEGAVNKAMSKVGMKPEDVETPDHRQAMLAYYAGLYLQSLDNKPKVSEALKGKAVSPKAPARKQKSTPYSSAIEKLNSNPNDKDSFVELFAS